MNAASTFPRDLWLRLVLALLVAMAGVFVLHHTVVAREQPLRPGRSAVRPAAAPPAGAASSVAALGFPLLPVPGTVLLASRVEAIPPDVAPVLQVLLDGSLAVRRPPRAATGPAGAAPAKGDHSVVALLLPRTPIGQWSVATRGAVIEVLGRWLTERPVPPSRLRDVDLGLRAPELATLLSWVP